MTSISQNLRYLPHTLETRYHAVKTYRNGASVAFICRRYKVSKASLMRWNKRFDGTKESLKDRSHRPLTPHPKVHTEQELIWIKNCIRRNPNATLIEIFYKLKTNKGYDRHPCSLFRVLRKLDFFKSPKTKQKTYVPKPYDTPTEIGIKWQMDVKYVPSHCYTGKLPDKFYQYTVIDEASRERFIYPFKEQSSHSTVQFLKMAIKHFGYKPNLMQVKSMLEKAFPEEEYPNTILHSDQGWQYQHEAYHRFLDRKGIHPSMSRKGTSTDNGMMKSFFGILKTEMFYGFEKSFKSLDHLEQAITEYIFYYNNKRIKAKLKGLSPVQYRTKSFH